MNVYKCSVKLRKNIVFESMLHKSYYPTGNIIGCLSQMEYDFLINNELADIVILETAEIKDIKKGDTMKVVTELVEEYREIWAVCPKCHDINYVGKAKKDSEPQKGEASCKNCSALYKWQEVKE